MVGKRVTFRRVFLLLIMVLSLASFLLSSVQITGIARNAHKHDPEIISAPFCIKENLDNDGSYEEYILKDHVLTVTEAGKTLYESPGDYRIDSFALGDINNDGNLNLVVSLWKEGSFGSMKPFWHTGEDKSYKNHLFVYRLQADTFRPVWFSSNLDHPILSFGIVDANGDGQNELTVMEGRYKKISDEKYTVDPAAPKLETVWKWDEWGFQKTDLPL